MKEAWTPEVILAINHKRTIKELSQFDNEKPGAEFGHFISANSYPNSLFKGRNIVDLDFMYKQYDLLVI